MYNNISVLNSRDKIENFIDENKALIKRMYGSFTVPGGNRVRRAPGVPDVHSGDSYFRHVRQASNTNLPNPQNVNSTGRYVEYYKKKQRSMACTVARCGTSAFQFQNINVMKQRNQVASKT